MDTGWAGLARQQAGMLSRGQLAGLGFDRYFIRTQVRARRWQPVGPVVVATHAGPLLRIQHVWAGVLTAGEGAMLSGLSALALAGLTGWNRDRDTIVVPKSKRLPVIPGIAFVESRRDLVGWRRRSSGLPPSTRRSPPSCGRRTNHLSVRRWACSPPSCSNASPADRT